MKLTHFSFDVDEHGVATVLMDVQGQKMNTISPKVAADLGEVIDRLENDDKVVAVVFGSAKPGSFIAGADIDVLRSLETASAVTELAADGQRAFARLEALHKERNKPVVAAIDGPCLGGGLELALACSLRLISDSPKTVLGMPEVKLGLFPGAGGTQRLPRLVGIANAIDLILTGRNVRGSRAIKLGLVDEIVPNPLLLEVARQRALAAARGEMAPPLRGLARLQKLAHEVADKDFLQQLALEENPVGQRVLFKKARDELLKKTRGNYPAPEKALEVIRIGIQEGSRPGYVAESDRFGLVSQTPAAKALMGIFVASQELKKQTWVPKGVVGRPLRHVGVLGGGLMGGGIAAVTVTTADLPVRIKEVDDAGVGRGLRHVRKLLDKDVSRRRRRAFDADRLMQDVTGSTTYSGFDGVDIVIEAVFEDLELKHRVLAEFEDQTRQDAIFASNTSSLPITDIAAHAARPENVIGMHYFSPVEKMPLLEIITTEKTADEVTATCVALGKAQGKTVIVVRDGTGFYTTRILAPLMNETTWMLSEGVAIDALDRAWVDWGFPVGPVTLLDEVGIDVALKVAKVMSGAFGDRMQPPNAMSAVAADDRMGRKNGRGFFSYEDGKKGPVDDTVYAVYGQSAKRHKNLPVEEMQLRLALQMVNEAARCLEEGILLSPRDGDIGAIFGLGFPPFRGGPFAYADHVGADQVVARLEGFASRFGNRFEPTQILRDYAASGKKFRS